MREKANSNNIERIFFTDLSSLYYIDLEGKRVWDDDDLKIYWNFFKLYVEKGGKLENLTIAPCHTQSFTKSISHDIKLNFEKCDFIGEMLILRESSTTFKDCIFYENLTVQNSGGVMLIERCVFSEMINFFHARLDSLIISRNSFYGSLSIKETTINKLFSVKDNFIKGEFSIIKPKFLGEKNNVSNLHEIGDKFLEFQTHIGVLKLQREYEKTLIDPNNPFSFQTYKSLSEENLVEYVKNESHLKKPEMLETILDKVHIFYNQYLFLDDNPSIRIVDLNVELSELVFYRIGLANFSFDSNLQRVEFNECDWDIKSRLILKEEERYKNERVEKQYRQLKRIFTNNQNWEMSGYAYSSEMEMRYRRLGRELDERKNYISSKGLEFLVYLFYGRIGGYTVNFVRPLAIFLILTFLIFPFIYGFLEPEDTMILDLPSGLKKSILGGFPIIKLTNIESDLWLLRTFQAILSVILIAFIILGLRKRFKQ